MFALAVGGWYLYERNANRWDVKQKEITIEYGENPASEDSGFDIKSYVDVEKYPKITEDNTSISFKSEFDKKDDKEYLAVGEWAITVEHTVEYKLFSFTVISFRDKKDIKLNVVDSVAPVFDETSPKEIEIIKDCKEDFTDKYKATDLAEVQITVEDENVDYSTVGEYTANVFATDASGNVSSYEVKVKIIEPSINIEPSSLELTVGETATLTVAIKGKEQNIEWSSSDESVAKIDNGNVTAIDAGTATITAKANGVEKTCEVVVKNKVAATSSNRQNGSSASASNSRSPSHSSGSGSATKPSSSTSNNNQNSSNSNQHNISVGNMGRWFNSRQELQNYYQSVANEWNKKYYDDKSISREEFNRNVPIGFEAYSCSHCGKWTGNFKYYR